MKLWEWIKILVLAYAKSQIASSNSLPTKGLAFISLKNSHKKEGIDLAKKLLKLNFTLSATEGTANLYTETWYEM